MRWRRASTRAQPAQALLILTLAAALLLTACGAAPAGDDTATDDPANRHGQITVFAAASLTAAFTEIGDAFEAAHPGSTVRFTFAGSGALATQITEGAPADVFASADLATMARARQAGAAAEDAVFATNRAQIIVEADNPLRITTLADLAAPEVTLVLCAPEVPCGTYARQILDTAQVTVTPRSLEENVRAVVTKVALGEADAGIVYATDVIAAGDSVHGIDIPAEVDIRAEYPIARTTAAPNPTGAQAFIEFVLSAPARQILVSHGFGAP